MGVVVSVGVTVGVEVSVGVDDSVGVSDCVRVGMRVGGYVGDGMSVLVTVGVGLIKKAFTDGFDESSHAATTRTPIIKFSTQKPITKRLKFFDEDIDI
jgi:hypothetical protein